MPNVNAIEKELEKIANELAEVGKYMSAHDQRTAAVNLRCHDGTVRQYIKGDVNEIKKLPFAYALLAELNKIRAEQTVSL